MEQQHPLGPTHHWGQRSRSAKGGPVGLVGGASRQAPPSLGDGRGQGVAEGQTEVKWAGSHQVRLPLFV